MPAIKSRLIVQENYMKIFRLESKKYLVVWSLAIGLIINGLAYWYTQNDIYGCFSLDEFLRCLFSDFPGEICESHQRLLSGWPFASLTDNIWSFTAGISLPLSKYLVFLLNWIFWGFTVLSFLVLIRYLFSRKVS